MQYACVLPSIMIGTQNNHSMYFSVITLQDVRQGEELTIHYMMDMEDASEWYLEAWEKFSIKSNQ